MTSVAHSPSVSGLAFLSLDLFSLLCGLTNTAVLVTQDFKL